MAMNFVRFRETETLLKKRGFKGIRAWKSDMVWVHYMIIHDPVDTGGDWHTASYQLNPALDRDHRTRMIVVNSKPMITRYSANDVMAVYDGMTNAEIACALTHLYLQQKLGLK